MNTSINFVLPKDKELVKRQKKGKVINAIAIIFPIMVGVVSLIIFLITQSINPLAIRKQQEEVIGKIAQLQDKKIKLFIIKDRLDNIEDLLKKRTNFSEKISSLISKTLGEVVVDSLEMDDNEVLMKVYSASLQSIDEFINRLIDMAVKKDVISSLSLNSLIFERSDNNYLVGLKSEL